jgi:hypothetical protein
MTDLPEEMTLRAFARKPKVYAPKAPRRAELKLKPDDTPPEERVTLDAIKDTEESRKCRWPYGSVGDGSFRFCGKPTTGVTSSWCDVHRKRAFYRVGLGHWDPETQGLIPEKSDEEAA